MVLRPGPSDSTILAKWPVPRHFCALLYVVHASLTTGKRHAPKDTKRSANTNFIRHKTIININDIFAINHNGL